MSDAVLKFSQKGPGRDGNGAVGASREGGQGNVAEGFPFWQSRLATVLGVSVELIRVAREGLVEGVDWVHQGQRVLFSEKGRAALEAQLRILDTGGPADRDETGLSADRRSLNTGPTEAAQQDEQPAPCPVLKMRVVRVCVNRHLVECVPADGNGMPVRGAGRVVVRVRSNENFVPGMLLQAQRLAGSAGGAVVFGLVGKCPRYRGRF